MYQVYSGDTEFLIPTYGDSFCLPDTIPPEWNSGSAEITEKLFTGSGFYLSIILM